MSLEGDVLAASNQHHCVKSPIAFELLQFAPGMPQVERYPKHIVINLNIEFHFNHMSGYNIDQLS